MFTHITQDNLLALVESFGREMHGLCSPYAHPYDDERRARPYPAKHAAARLCWKKIKYGHDPIDSLKALQVAVGGHHSSAISLIIKALNGDFDVNEGWFTTPLKGFFWVTYGGDFYGVDRGDYLNLPCVTRIANKHMPKEKQVITGSQMLADMILNPCTRITAHAQAH